MSEYKIGESERGIFQSIKGNDLPLLRKYLLSKVDLNKLSLPMQNLAEKNIDHENVSVFLMDSVSPLSYAIICQNIEAIELLIVAGAKSGSPPDNAIEVAVKTGNILILKKILSLLEAVTDFNLRLAESQLFWAMQSAIYQGRVDMLEEMKNAGANVFMVDEEGITLLMDAALSNQVEVAKFLIELGIDINARDSDGKTALLLSAQSGNQEVFEYLYTLTSDQKEREAAHLKLASSMQDDQNDLPVISPEMIDFLNSDDFYW